MARSWEGVWFIVPGSRIGVSGKNVGFMISDLNHNLECTIPLCWHQYLCLVSVPTTGAILTPGILLALQLVPRTSCM